MNQETQIAERAGTAPQAAGDGAQTFALLQQAVTAGTSPEALEKLVALQERILARNAAGEFAVAISEFQSRCPTIEKTHSVKDRNGRLLYRFAPLEDIARAVRPLLAELGLSYSFSAEELDGATKILCTVRHRSGHMETTQVQIPRTKGINTNAAQDQGIVLTYGYRYALTGALGITTADEDPDGRQRDVATITSRQQAEIRALGTDVGADMAAFLRYVGARTIADIQQKDFGRAIAALERKRGTK